VGESVGLAAARAQAEPLEQPRADQVRRLAGAVADADVLMPCSVLK